MSNAVTLAEMQLDLFQEPKPCDFKLEIEYDATHVSMTDFPETIWRFGRQAQVGELLYIVSQQESDSGNQMLDQALSHLETLGTRGEAFVEFVQSRFRLNSIDTHSKP